MINWFKRASRKFLNAFRGLMVMIKEEKSLWVHFLTTVIVIIMGILSNLDLSSWIAIVFSIALVISFEIMNTAIEYLVDIVSFEFNVKAKKIKDVAATATLIVTIAAMIIGVLVFGHAWQWF